MITKITGEQPFQILTNNFSISPSQEGYTLQISADGRQYSNLFTVGAGVTRLVTGVAANSYYRLSGNQSEVSVNWMKTCVTEGGGSGTELQPVADFPLNAVEGTVISYTGSSSASGVYQYDGNEWTAVGTGDLSAYWTSAETQSAITAVEDHLFDVEQVTASALTELHDDVLELSARTVDLSAYTPTANFATINGSAITNGGNIVIQGGGGDMSDYWTSAETKTYVDSGITIVQDQIGTLDDVVSAALVDLNDRVDEISGSTPSVDLSGYYTSAQTEDAISYALIPYYTSAQTNTAISAATQDMVESTDVKHIVKLTQAEYDALTDKDPYTFYIIISNS